MLVKAWVDEKGQIANWGDILNGELVRLLTGEMPKLINANAILKTENFMVIGSILRFVDRETVVWGAGFLTNEEECTFRPKKILAVRGPKTRQRLLDLGIDCPEVYGDPALLLPLFYKPKVEKKFRLGIVVHWTDQFHDLVKPMLYANRDGVTVFPAQDFETLKAKGTDRFDKVSVEGIYRVIDTICSCERIASSSLHGLVCADAYKIPNVRIKFRELTGGDFKFDDYAQSIGRRCVPPLDCTSTLDYSWIAALFGDNSYWSNLPKVTENLLAVSPWRKDGGT